MKYDAGVNMTTQNKTENKIEKTEFQRFLEQEKQRLDAEKERRMAEGGLRDFLKIKEGETMVEVKPEPARVNKTYPERFVFHVRSITEDKEYDMSVNKDSPLYRDVVDNMIAGHLNLKIVRIGTTKSDTRYKVTPI